LPFTEPCSIDGTFTLEADSVFQALSNPAKPEIARKWSRALIGFTSSTELDPRVLVGMWLVETNDGRSFRWTHDPSPAGFCIPGGDSRQAFPISDGDAAAAIFVQAQFSQVHRDLDPELPVSTGARQWFDAVWLPKGIPPPRRQCE
jgi:hypothetical protein